ncbi:MAG: histidine ammonia-lyase [candidate division WOR-3 bacterium]|nr:histidine ammonia-lyase [candidate division WOR-3 bacterium]
MVLIPQPQLDFETIKAVAQNRTNVGLNKKSIAQIIKSHSLVNQVAKGKTPVYGVNTGFGALANILLEEDNIKDLQKNLILSHAVGAGSFIKKEIVRTAMFLRANMLAKGYSGVRPQLINLLLTMLNKDIVPLVPETGSVGASGDLAPLAFIALTLLGYGKVWYQNKMMPTKSVFKRAGINPLNLEPKEGLALINGTEVMSASGVWVVSEARYLTKINDIASAMSIVALQGKIEPFDLRIMNLKPHPEQTITAKTLLKLLSGYTPNKKQVQDAYSLRCIPQVSGAVKMAINFAKQIVTTELNSVTDNPIIVDNTIISGGNFHGQALSLAMDCLAVGLTTLGLISERRIFRLLDDKLSGLPPFLVKDAGVNSGLMMLQVLAGALCAENKVLSHPASIQSVSTSASQEDFVSMGMTACNKVQKILENVLTILAIEIICARQAIELAKYKVPSKLDKFYKIFSDKVPFITKDRLYQDDIEQVKDLLLKDGFRKLLDDTIHL